MTPKPHFMRSALTLSKMIFSGELATYVGVATEVTRGTDVAAGVGVDECVEPLLLSESPATAAGSEYGCGQDSEGTGTDVEACDGHGDFSSESAL